jgi:hypothetical protein
MPQRCVDVRMCACVCCVGLCVRASGLRRRRRQVCCGMYFPSIGTMRGKFVPEEVRSTIMNIFRIGLNLIVVVVLWNVRAAPHARRCR